MSGGTAAAYPPPILQRLFLLNSGGTDRDGDRKTSPAFAVA